MSTPSLTSEELRVLACLVEKSHTTPEQYPLSTNALTAACNQKSSRDPMVDYSPQLVDRVLRLLRDGGWARSIRGSGNRAFKHRHVVDERLGLDTPRQAVLAVLALRGPQSPGELKTRTDRYHPFADLDEVEAVLQDLAARADPLVRNIGRASGQSQDRWVQLLGPLPGADHIEIGAPASTTDAAPASPESTRPGPPTEAAPSAAAEVPVVRPGARAGEAGGGAVDREEVDRLRRRVQVLEDRLAALEAELGLGPA